MSTQPSARPPDAAPSAWRHALFVAYHYPPEASSSGVLRTLKYTQYLQRFGWRVSVLTVREAAYSHVDASLQAQIPPDVRVIRTASLDSKRHLSIAGRYPSVLAIPDRWVWWAPWALAAGARLFREDPFQLIYSSSPHATAHLIAGRLSGRCGLPWVADFRDPWYEEPPEPDTTAIVHWAARHLERWAVHKARKVTTSTPELADQLAARYPDCPGDKFRAIVNGYDEADFSELPYRSGDSGRFRMLHAGAINPAFRDPRPLFRALRRLIDEGAADPRELHLQFLGPGDFGQSEALADAVRQTGLQQVVEFLPRIPYAQSLQALRDADLLLLLQASEDTRSLVPAKLYEYLRAQRPVLALVLPGACDRLLDQTGGGWSVSPQDEQALAAALGAALAKWRSGNLDSTHADLATLRRYSRERLTGQLAAVFDQVSADATA